MSAQFGMCNFDGKPVSPQELDRVRPVLAQYGPDAEGIFCKENVGILHRAFHTTKESRLVDQPFISPSGAVITWDGRLDNRAELVHELGETLPTDSTDLLIVNAAFEHWGTDSFAKLIGDWAVSIWNPRSRTLVLAKDFIGTRQLYYSIDKEQISWSTVLDPLVLFGGHTFALSEEYIAGWLSFFPAVHVTPYAGIDSVPPATFVLLRPGKHSINKYWDFDPCKRIRYRTDGEYEEEFRTVFAEAVRRRLRADNPVLAELSGGMDSSSIVCIADSVLARGTAETPRLDTISYYNDTEPNWDERPYFRRIEEVRGRTGCHIDVSSQQTLPVELANDEFVAAPASGRVSSEAAKQFRRCLATQGNRVVLSGIGGDEVTGGIPTPTPELQDLIASASFRALAHRLKVWALHKRQPWFHLLFEAIGEFLPPAIAGVPERRRAAPWLHPEFIRRNRGTLLGYERRLRLFGPRPSFQDNLGTVNVLCRQLGCSPPLSNPPYELRYPYLDRDLLEFLLAIPREQLIRPGQRRSLMRRALVDIVPDQVLNRRRKAFVSRNPLKSVSLEWSRIADAAGHMALSSIGILEPRRFLETLERARTGQEVSTVLLLRTFTIEAWLKHLGTRGILIGTNEQSPDSNKYLVPTAISAENN
jgi:asparagine synthase (glutamine-hydrolysing)